MKKILLISTMVVLLTISNGFAMMGGMGCGMLEGFFGLFGGHHGPGHGGGDHGASGYGDGHHGNVAPVNEATDGHDGHDHGDTGFSDTYYDDHHGDGGFVDGHRNGHDR